MIRFFRRLRDQIDRNYAKEDIVTWASALAHEIKNPLNTMRINLQLLEEEWEQEEIPNKEKSLWRLKTLNNEVNRLETILNDFMRFVRLPKPNFQKQNLSVLLNELLDFIEPESNQLNIEIIRDFKSDLPEVDIDPVQIKQALLNLILNANQAMPSGGQITVRAYKTDGYVTVDIIDTGQGIEQDKLEKVFDLFYSTKEDGTGLGLPIAKRIVNMHDGDILVKSKVGKGSTFSVVLPVSQRN